MDLRIFCADIGSIQKGNFGWASCDPECNSLCSGTSIEDFAQQIVDELRQGRSVALGFECPLFVPFRESPVELTRARVGEGSRPWSAAGGAGSLATGLTETVWVLSQIHASISPEPALYFCWQKFAEAGSGLLLWEAFVTGAIKADSHEGDAMLAVRAFASSLPNPNTKNIIEEPEVFSLIAASALRSGWLDASSLVNVPCLVIAA